MGEEFGVLGKPHEGGEEWAGYMPDASLWKGVGPSQAGHLISSLPLGHLSWGRAVGGGGYTPETLGQIPKCERPKGQRG